MKKPSECNHENFAANVTVNRLEDSGRFIADVTVKCSECDTPFHFMGVAYGLNFEGPALSADSLELRIPIAPGAVMMPAGSTATFRLPNKGANA